MAAAPTTPHFASQAIALLLAELEQLSAPDFRAVVDEAMAEARAEREAKLAEQPEISSGPPLPPILKGGCGDKYADLLIVRGNGPDDPCGILEEWACSNFDAEAYNVRADEIYAYCLAAWNLLATAENERGSWPETSFLTEHPFWSAYEGMMRWSKFGAIFDDDADLFLYNGQVVQSSLSVMRDGICCLQQLNEALDRVTGKEVEPPFVPEEEPLIEIPDLPKPLSNAFTFIGLAIAVAVGFVVYNRLKD